jgi:hypothetical protein
LISLFLLTGISTHLSKKEAWHASCFFTQREIQKIPAAIYSPDDPLFFYFYGPALSIPCHAGFFR